MRKLMEKKIDPPFVPEKGQLAEMKFFNKKQSPQDLVDTVVPQAKQKKVNAHQDAFKDFDQSNRKK